MIVDVFGEDIFHIKDVNAKIIVTVNCVGIMGAGIALQCKKLYPRESAYYFDQCKKKLVKPGEPFEGLYSIIFFPTKNHWRNPSKISWIKKGLPKLLEFDVRTYVAVPPLGCGHGGLNWKRDVYPMIVDALSDSPTEFRIYHPR